MEARQDEINEIITKLNDISRDLMTMIDSDKKTKPVKIKKEEGIDSAPNQSIEDKSTLGTVLKNPAKI